MVTITGELFLNKQVINLDYLFLFLPLVTSMQNPEELSFFFGNCIFFQNNETHDSDSFSYRSHCQSRSIFLQMRLVWPCMIELPANFVFVFVFHVATIHKFSGKSLTLHTLDTFVFKFYEVHAYF